jgi:hypothetical protein
MFDNGSNDKQVISRKKLGDHSKPLKKVKTKLFQWLYLSSNGSVRLTSMVTALLIAWRALS